jgi:hypothetical protein
VEAQTTEALQLPAIASEDGGLSAEEAQISENLDIEAVFNAEALNDGSDGRDGSAGLTAVSETNLTLDVQLPPVSLDDAGSFMEALPESGSQDQDLVSLKPSDQN